MEWRYRHGLVGLCALAYFGSRVGQLAVGPLVPEITAAFGVSTAAVGAALTGMWAAYALVQYPAGVAGDRFGERRVVLGSLVAAAVGAGALALAPTFAAFVLVAVLLGAGVGLYYNAGTALLARRFDADAVGRAIGVHRVGGQAAGLIAPVAATAVAVRAGWRAGLLVGVVAAVPAALLVHRGVRPTPSRRPNGSAGLSAGLVADLLARPGLAYATTVAVLAEFAGMATTSFLPAFLVAAHGASLEHAGVVVSGYFLAVGLAQPVTGWLSDRAGREPATALATLAGAAGYALLVIGGPGAVAPGVALAGYAMSWSAPVQADVVDRLGDDERGAGFGVVRSVYVLLGATGSVVVGAAADAVGWRPAFGLLVGVMLAASALAAAAWGVRGARPPARSR